MVTVSFNKEYVTVIVELQDDTLFELARDLSNNMGLSLRDFENLTIEGRY
jgi:hypothetical protein